MRNQLSSIDEEEQNELPNSIIHWWRTAKDFDENGNFKIELSDLSKLTPRIKLLREMERLSFVAEAEGFDNLRQKLVAYKSGDFCVPIGGIKKEDMDIPPAITILLVGLNGSGKSSVINMMYSILGRTGLIPFAQTSSGSLNFTTMYLEEHNVVRSARGGFCVYDTRGIDINQLEASLQEISTWIIDGVSHNQLCSRPCDEKTDTSARTPALDSSLINNGCRYTKRKVNYVMVVANLAEINEAFLSGDFKSLQAIGDIFQLPCINTSNGSPILILTHGDMLKTEERLTTRLKVCEYLGISETTGAYDIACLSEQGILPSESDPVTAFAVTEAVYRSLIMSDRSHRPKRKFMDWITLFVCWFMCCVASFFAILARFFSRFEHNHKKLKF